jgi:hypothetical protein
MKNKERKDLLSEKSRLINLLKPYNNESDWDCLMAEVLVKRILNIEELLNHMSTKPN